jgi:hypothetical protein
MLVAEKKINKSVIGASFSLENDVHTVLVRFLSAAAAEVLSSSDPSLPLPDPLRFRFALEDELFGAGDWVACWAGSG